jgi:hypothetical protein
MHRSVDLVGVPIRLNSEPLAGVAFQANRNADKITQTQSAASDEGCDETEDPVHIMKLRGVKRTSYSAYLDMRHRQAATAFGLHTYMTVFYSFLPTTVHEGVSTHDSLGRAALVRRFKSHS